jgi:hypothetical protein
MEIRFTHPTNSGYIFIADVEPACTGQQAILGLLAGDEVNGPFLPTPPPGRPYELVLARTQQQIAPNMSFEEANVIEGDVIDVLQLGQGY